MKSKNKQPASANRWSELVLPLLESWKREAEELSRVLKLFDAVTHSSPECPLKNAAWGVFAGYTEVLAAMIGDNDGWLEWFAWECDFGNAAKEVQFSDGEKLLVVGVEDLLDAIWSNPDGTRYFWKNASVMARPDGGPNT